MNERKEEKASRYQNPVRGMFAKMGEAVQTKKVYGEPIELEDKKVVPVSKVTYLFGGGGGTAEETKEGSSLGEGEGGGGTMLVRPVGVYEITKKKTRFIPTVDLSALLLLVGAVTFLFSILMRKNKRTKEK
ncbi:spore germination protein GerW family protein [Alkalihalobacterium chitinilyticum]|uniref:Spore germination protein GerW family protein n=1 Tax=Alkalihalobacterium chitinilyticum TaxID=2980103 RepID=A0ABT5VK13_9BACI|nr:spore germination protein GerW family protein [Alkalihalobacterium chitinilyticum]MDE5415546.1 spore germination protein GerW family protein [Alkalihalobacterium chitinilyticum]